MTDIDRGYSIFPEVFKREDMVRLLEALAAGDLERTKSPELEPRLFRPTGPSGKGAFAELQQTLARAWVGGDRATVERIIAPDWRGTGPESRMTDRAGVLADVFDARRHRIHRVEIDDVHVRVFGDAAVVTGRTHGVGEARGSAYDVVIRFSDTFVRREGRWQAVASHASLLDSRQ